jgi:hypothetical protein
MITLYIKTHKLTGLKYFGKTTKSDVHKYKGSGHYWIRHIKKYGNLVDTKIVAQFDDEEECKKFALDFSLRNNIVESKEWANLRIENGVDGAPVGNTFSQQTIKKMSDSKKGKKSKQYFVEIAKKNVGRKQSDHQKQKAREFKQLSWKLITPEGNEFLITNLRKFCMENNLDQGNMVKVSQGILKQHKGWKCIKTA